MLGYLIKRQLTTQDRLPQLVPDVAHIFRTLLESLEVAFSLFARHANMHDMELGVPAVVNRHAPPDVLASPELELLLEIEHVGHESGYREHTGLGRVPRMDDQAGGGRGGDGRVVVGLHKNGRRGHGAAGGAPPLERVSMDEADVGDVEIVFQILEVVAVAHVAEDLDDPFLAKARDGSKWGCLALAEVSEDRPQIFMHRPAGDAHFAREGFVLGRLLHAQAGGVVLPAEVKPPQATALPPSP